MDEAQALLSEEREKAWKLVDALEEIASGKVLPQLIAQQVLQQWKDRKEVEKAQITEEQVQRLLAPPDADLGPKGMPLPAEYPFKK